MRSKLLLTFFCLPLITCNVHAAGKENRYSIRGAGLLTCENYIAEQEKKSDAYFMIGGWIDGFITGSNQHMSDTYDVTSFESTELLALIIGRHCKQNPDDRLFSVVNSILTGLHNKRIINRSALVNVTVADKETFLYTEVIRRMQQRLNKRGLYKGEANGEFDQSLEESISSFQRSQKMNPTGFPDQSTLWKLLR